MNEGYSLAKNPIETDSFNYEDIIVNSVDSHQIPVIFEVSRNEGFNLE